MSNLTKRIITSTILLLILSIILFYNKYIWLFTLILASLILFIEFQDLSKKIWKKKKENYSYCKYIFFIFSNNTNFFCL